MGISVLAAAYCGLFLSTAAVLCDLLQVLGERCGNVRHAFHHEAALRICSSNSARPELIGRQQEAE